MAAREAIHTAAMAGDAEGVARMLDEDPRLLSAIWGGDALLTQAARWGHVGVSRLLLERGAEVNAPTSVGGRALNQAARRGYEELVSLLLSSGAETNMRGSNGWTALMEASYNGQVAVVRLLLRSMGRRGLDERSDDGRTALQFASGMGHVDIVRILLLAGADHTIADNEGRTPQQVGPWQGLFQCEALLQWWEGELQRVYVLHRARTLHDDTATRQQAPAAAVPAYLSPRAQAGKRLPGVQIQGSGGSGGPRTRGAAKRGAEGEEKKKKEEEEMGAMVGYVVKELDGHLYTELMQGLRLR